MATGFSASVVAPALSSGSATTNLSELYKKQSTDLEIAIKLVTEEARDMFQDIPRNAIVVGANENRIPVLLTQPLPGAWIPEAGKEAIMTSPQPTHGTFLPVQLSKRHGFSAMAQAFDSRAASAMIENQLTFQSNMSGYGMGWSLGLSTYGTSVGTIAVVKTTGSGGTTQNGIAIKNAFGSATFVPGGDGDVQDKYLCYVLRPGTIVALIRSAALVEFGKVNASPSAVSGAGFIDVTFASSITPTSGDLIVNAMADGDVTITGTDYNNVAYGWTDFLTGSPMGISPTTYPAWSPGSTQTTTQRWSFAVKERIINECYTASGLKPDRFIVPFGVRRDAISGELGARRYDSADTDIEGDLTPGKGQKYFTTPLALPQTVIAWNRNAVQKVELSSKQTEDAPKSAFKLDKIQGVSGTAAYYDWFMQRLLVSAGATGYATKLQSA